MNLTKFPGSSRYRYLLGYTREETDRLRAQARLWDPVSLALFDRLGIRPGWNVLEIGPGQGSLHLALRQRVEGPVDAVERSPVFAARLAAITRRDGFGAGRIWQSDLIDASLPRGTYDLIFARWVFLFLPDPAAHVKQLARALKPGGLLAIQDYHRDTFALVPRPEEWTNFMAADRAFFASEGGDASIGPRLPDLYRAAGLDVTSIEPTVKAGHPGSPVWNWLTSYFMGVMDRYAAFPPFDRAQARRIRAAWRRAEQHRASLLIGPALLDVVGKKPRRR
jgi:SAM-dependent methyltransferase